MSELRDYSLIIVGLQRVAAVDGIKFYCKISVIYSVVRNRLILNYLAI